MANFESRRSKWHKVWLKVLNSYGVSFDNYNFERLQHPFVVYVKLSAKHNLTYGGFTAQGMVHRELARIRKYRQGTLSNAEPAIIYWRQKKKIFKESKKVKSEIAWGPLSV